TKHQHQQQKHGPSEHIHGNRESRQQVQSECRRPNHQRSPCTRQQPFVLIAEPRQSQKQDVVVLHHVLCVVQVGGTQQQGENPGPCLLHGEFQKSQKAKAHQRGKHIEESV